MSLILKKILSDNELVALNGFLIPQQSLHLNNVKVVILAARQFWGGAGLEHEVYRLRYGSYLIIGLNIS